MGASTGLRSIGLKPALVDSIAEGSTTVGATNVGSCLLAATASFDYASTPRTPIRSRRRRSGRCSPSDAQDRLVANIGGHLGEVDEDGVRERSPAYLRAASSELADRVGEKLGAAAEVPAE